MTVLFGDALAQLKTLESESVQACVTSPPYWAQRDYLVESQLGLEPTPEEFVDKLVDVFREVRRVLKESGTCWINIGDTYARPPAGNKVERADRRQGRLHSAPRTPSLSINTVVGDLKEKDLVGVPWMLAMALRKDGWYLRADIIWDKQQNLPESVKDRPTTAHEHIFMLSKSRHYFYDKEAVSACSRSVWSVTTSSKASVHTATYPIDLPRRCILLGTVRGDTVLDPFLGSGTTAAAAVELGRAWVGVELNESCKEEIEGNLAVAQGWADQAEIFDVFQDME